jgi:hypothetical protein
MENNYAIKNIAQHSIRRIKNKVTTQAIVT